jgi:hypothetical protein
MPRPRKNRPLEGLPPSDPRVRAYLQEQWNESALGRVWDAAGGHERVEGDVATLRRQIPTAFAHVQHKARRKDLPPGFMDGEDFEALRLADTGLSGNEKLAVSEVLDALRLSPTELAKFLGVGVATLYSWVDPERTMRPGPERLRALDIWLRFAIHRLELVAEKARWAAEHAPPIKRGGARKKKSRKEKGGN